MNIPRYPTTISPVGRPVGPEGGEPAGVGEAAEPEPAAREGHSLAEVAAVERAGARPQQVVPQEVLELGLVLRGRLLAEVVVVGDGVLEDLGGEYALPEDGSLVKFQS